MRGYEFNVYLRFQQVVERFPDQPAIVTNDGENVDYRSLSNMVDRLTSGLMQSGIESGRPIVVLHDKSVACFALILTTLRLGIPYSCLDIENPASRIVDIVDRLNSRFVLGPNYLLSLLREKVLGLNLETVSIEHLAARAAQKIERPLPIVTSDRLAYVMFTSGSTGKPKGVAITHANVLNLSSWARDYLAIGSGTRMTNVNPMHFDNSVFDFYCSLLNGATLLPIDKILLANFSSLAKFVANQTPSFWFSVPSTLIYLQSMKVLTPKFLERFDTIMFGGEGFPVPQLRKLAEKVADTCKLVNVYGPTECTCICSAREVGGDDLNSSASGIPPLGELLPNFEGRIVDNEGKEVAVGETGELHLYGPNVGLGYYRDEERTKESFFKEDFWGISRKGYRTGDLIRMNPESAEYEFVGRSDNQIKHMGYRIELEEIELALVGLSGIDQAAVIYRRRNGGGGHIVSFYSGEAELIESEIRSGLVEYLPGYMIPHSYTWMTELPKNANGKIDKKLLAERLA